MSFVPIPDSPACLFLTAGIMISIGISLIIGPGHRFEISGVEAGTITAKEAPSVRAVFANIVPSNPIAAAASNGEML